MGISHNLQEINRLYPFRLVYGHEVVMPMEYIVLILSIVVITEMTYVDAVKEILLQLVQLEEEHFVAWYHQNVEI